MKMAPLRILVLVVSLSFIIANGDASGGISIDCGVTQESRDDNNFYYEADDEKVVEFGKIYNVSPEYVIDSKEEQVWKQLNTLRSFPQGKRNCYSLKPKQGKDNTYLVRAYFMYGNYDHKNSVPYFHFHLGVNFWRQTDLLRGDVNITERIEVIHVSPTDNVDVCLINIGDGTPFISLLELWPLKNSVYRTTSNLLPLDLMARFNLGMSKSDYAFVRYPDDIYGRSWLNRQIDNTEPISALEAIESDASDYKLPNEVLSTAIQSRNSSSSLVINLYLNADYEYYVYLHFFDFVEHSPNQLRKMDIAFNDTNRVPITLRYRELQTILRIIPKGVPLDNISISSSSGSGLPPMINALEIFGVLPQPYVPTNEGDVYAMWNIKHAYNIRRISWQGDPCMPPKYRWEGVTCNYSIPRITSLNMSSSKLKGDMITYFSKFLMLESLDLSNNQLTAEIPQCLAELPNLKVLNLTGNNLTGSVPKALWEKSRTGLLILRLDGNPGLCQNDYSCKTITKKFIIPVVASVTASVAALAIIVYISMMLYKRKRRKQNALPKKDGELKPRYQAFCQDEVLSITNDFESVIGEGGFGKVYLGRLQDGTQVAVKLLSKSSGQGFNEFESEAKLLSMVYHKSLVSLVGYCDDGDMRALIYEYMANGNLRHQLSDKNPYVLKWNERLHIALDAACGLDYLHNGCKPPIIHRDLKTSNILLSENMQAKIADFGLSKAFANDVDTHISTRPAGTFGYLDPEFYRTGSLNKKSDVYSFGIILLELMTGRPAIVKTPKGTSHIVDWVTPKVETGDIQSIMDPRLEGKFNSASAWKLFEIARSCIQPTGIQRPDISYVESDLKQCLALETPLLESAESSSFISSTAFDTSYSQCGSHSPPSDRPDCSQSHAISLN